MTSRFKGPIAYYVSGVAGFGWVEGGDNFLRGLILGGQLFRKYIKCEGGRNSKTQDWPSM